MSTPTETQIREAYAAIAAEKGLTVQFAEDGLPIVPPHWRYLATSVAIGLAQSAAGEVEYLGDFSQYDATLTPRAYR